MDPFVELADVELSVAPGSEARTRVTMQNDGTVQTEYEVAVLGPTADYATVTPARVIIGPSEKVTAEVVFRPLRDSATLTGRIPFGVRVMSLEQDGSSVAEGDLTVGDFAELTVKLIPTRSRGRWKGRHKLTIENNGNGRPTMQVRPDEDSAEDMSFAFTPDANNFVLPPGKKREFYLTARTKRPTWFGKPALVPFTLLVEEPSRRIRRETVGTVARGTFEQRKVISPGMILGAGALLLPFVLLAMSAGKGESFEPHAVRLDPPLGVSVEQAEVNTLRVSWDVVQGADGYLVSSADLPESVKVDGNTFPTQPIGDLDPAKRYCFAVVATSADKEVATDSKPSAQTDLACGTPSTETPVPGPLEPRASWGLPDSPDYRTLTLRWVLPPGQNTNETKAVVELNGKDHAEFAADMGARVEGLQIPDSGPVSRVRVSFVAIGKKSIPVEFALPEQPPVTTLPATTAAPPVVVTTPKEPVEKTAVKFGESSSTLVLPNRTILEKLLEYRLQILNLVRVGAASDLGTFFVLDLDDDGTKEMAFKGWKDSTESELFCRLWNEGWDINGPKQTPSSTSTPVTIVTQTELEAFKTCEPIALPS